MSCWAGMGRSAGWEPCRAAVLNTSSGLQARLVLATNIHACLPACDSVALRGHQVQPGTDACGYRHQLG